MEPTYFSTFIAVPPDAFTLAKLLGGPVYLVGGAVRDHLYTLFHGGEPSLPKDADLTTPLSEQEVLAKLQSPEARARGVRVKEKESVDTFGVVFASVNGGKTIEIAPFRKDVGSADGRHPERVECGTIEDDAARRDLTINSLYYDISNQTVVDFNGGVEDIRSKKVRTVGPAHDRFAEDKLRVLRFVRFFSRYNDGDILEHADPATITAAIHFSDLHSYKGMSPERIQVEFLSGLHQSLDTARYLQNYRRLHLLPAVFGGADVDTAVIPKLGNLKNERVVLAMLLRNVPKVDKVLNALKYPNEIAGPVSFWVEAMRFTTEQAFDVLKMRDRNLILPKDRELREAEAANNERHRRQRERDASDIVDVVDDPTRKLVIEHLMGHVPHVPDGEWLMTRGLKGKAVGDFQRKEVQRHYLAKLGVFFHERGVELP